MTSSRLEYDAAFDAAAAWLGGFGPGCIALVSDERFAADVQLRASGPVLVARGAADLIPAARSTDVLVWAAPQIGTWRTLLPAVVGSVRPGGALCVLTATRIGAAVTPLRRGRRAGEPDALYRHVRRALLGWGFRIDRVHAIGGLASVAWAAAGRAALLARRTALADRAERAYHDAIESQFGASYAVLLARWPGTA